MNKLVEMNKQEEMNKLVAMNKQEEMSKILMMIAKGKPKEDFISISTIKIQLFPEKK